MRVRRIPPVCHAVIWDGTPECWERLAEISGLHEECTQRVNDDDVVVRTLRCDDDDYAPFAEFDGEDLWVFEEGVKRGSLVVIAADPIRLTVWSPGVWPDVWDVIGL